jgi:hypothetical protein
MNAGKATLTRTRLAVALGLTVALIVAAPSPAQAVSNGELDGDDHPNVACLLGQRADGTFVGCGTGQLIGPRVVLVAAHEFAVLRGLGATRYFVSFDPVVDPASSRLYEAASIHIAPSFNPISFAGLDLAVVQLSTRVAGVTPIALPAEGALDRLAEQGSLSGQDFVIVGYGRDCTGSSPSACVPAFDTTRRFAKEHVISLHGDRFSVQANSAATGTGGACFGDSGSPHFLGDSNVSVGVTRSISGGCNAVVDVTRLDTPAARAFIGEFVALP